MEFFINNILLIFILPLIIAIFALYKVFFKYSFSDEFIGFSGIISALIGFIFSAGIFYTANKYGFEPIEYSVNWFGNDIFSFNLGILIDNLSSVFLLLLSSVYLIVNIYSLHYIDKGRKYPVYYFFLNLFYIAMAGLILSPNLFEFFVCWECLGLLSYLFVNYNFTDYETQEAAKRVYITNVIGDVFLIAGIIAIYYVSYNYELGTDLHLSNFYEIFSNMYVYISDYGIAIISFLFLGAAITKSALFPAHTWLIDAMKAPTPISALIHSATMVTAGIILLLRTYPMISNSPIVMKFIAILGILTAFVCAFFAISQKDIKKMLAYSTSSNLGLAASVIGIGFPVLAVFYIAAHAFSKALLFLIAGITIKDTNTHNMDNMKNYASKSSLIFIAYIVGVLSLTGLCFGGYFAKEQIAHEFSYYPVFEIFIIITVMFSAYYLGKSLFSVFIIKKEEETNIKSDENKVYNMLSIKLSIVMAVLFLLVFTFFNFKYFHYSFVSNYKMAIPQFKINAIVLTSIMFFINIVSLFVSYYVSKKNLRPLPSFLDKISLKGGYLPEIYEFINNYIFDTFRKLNHLIHKLINKIFELLKYPALDTSKAISEAQTGNFQTYLASAVVITGFIMFIVIYFLDIIWRQ